MRPNLAQIQSGGLFIYTCRRNSDNFLVAAFSLFFCLAMLFPVVYEARHPLTRARRCVNIASSTFAIHDNPVREGGAQLSLTGGTPLLREMGLNRGCVCLGVACKGWQLTQSHRRYGGLAAHAQTVSFPLYSSLCFPLKGWFKG